MAMPRVVTGRPPLVNASTGSSAQDIWDGVSNVVFDRASKLEAHVQRDWDPHGATEEDQFGMKLQQPFIAISGKTPEKNKIPLLFMYVLYENSVLNHNLFGFHVCNATQLQEFTWQMQGADVRIDCGQAFDFYCVVPADMIECIF